MTDRPKILCIDTSLDVCSVAVEADGMTHFREERGFNIHSARLNLMTEALLNDAGLGLKDLDALCIDKGPGSYTGLRIGVSSAKGYCYGLDIPLLSINTLDTMAAYAKSKPEPDENTLLCPMIDARRMEVYYKIQKADGTLMQDTKAEVADETFCAEWLKNYRVLFFGNGMPKCRHLLEQNHNAGFAQEDIYPRADHMLQTAAELYQRHVFEDVYRFEPFYLKDFYTTANIKL